MHWETKNHLTHFIAIFSLLWSETEAAVPLGYACIRRKCESQFIYINYIFINSQIYFIYNYIINTCL